MLIEHLHQMTIFYYISSVSWRHRSGNNIDYLFTSRSKMSSWCSVIWCLSPLLLRARLTHPPPSSSPPPPVPSPPGGTLLSSANITNFVETKFKVETEMQVKMYIWSAQDQAKTTTEGRVLLLYTLGAVTSNPFRGFILYCTHTD